MISYVTHVRPLVLCLTFMCTHVLHFTAVWANFSASMWLYAEPVCVCVFEVDVLRGGGGVCGQIWSPGAWCFFSCLLQLVVMTLPLKGALQTHIYNVLYIEEKKRAQHWALRYTFT